MIAFPMVFTMFIAGVWHGAGPQFVLYGLLHGTLLTINHAWKILRPKREDQAPSPFIATIYHCFCVLLTYLCVLITLVFFRSNGIGNGMSILAGMVGLHKLGSNPAALYRGENAAHTMLKVAVGLVIVWFLPNTQEILRRFKPSLQAALIEQERENRWLQWSPNIAWALTLGCIFFFSLVSLQDPSTFLYFQF